MSTSCSTTPSSISTESFTTTTVITSYTATQTVFPPSISTSIGCPTVDSDSSASSGPSSISNAQCVPATSITTIRPESTGVSSIPVTITSIFTSSRVSTLYGSSCTVIPIPAPDTFTQTQTEIHTRTQTQTETTTEIHTSATTYTSQAVTTDSNGIPTTINFTIVSTVTVPAEIQSSSPSPTAERSSSSHTGPIIGGVIGSIAVLILVIIVVWYVSRRERRRNDVFDDFDVNDFPAAATSNNNVHMDTVPKPYMYSASAAQSLSFSNGVHRGLSMVSRSASDSSRPWSSHQPLMSDTSPANSAPSTPRHERFPSRSSVASGSSSLGTPGFFTPKGLGTGTRFVANPDENTMAARFQTVVMIPGESASFNVIPPSKGSGLGLSSSATGGSVNCNSRSTRDEEHPPPAYKE